MMLAGIGLIAQRLSKMWNGNIPYRPDASSSSLFRPKGSPTTKAAADPAKAPKRERLTISPD